VAVNSVAPGFIQTDISGGVLTGERKEQLVAPIPVGRGGKVNDVADLITFLCREESSYIAGVTYDVNGGSHIH
jgi:NAD(P)-dependent dehydrogenase (short-subunit alcohol dehydrogenase family)